MEISGKLTQIGDTVIPAKGGILVLSYGNLLSCYKLFKRCSLWVALASGAYPEGGLRVRIDNDGCRF